MSYDLTIIIPFYNSQKFISKNLENFLIIQKKHNIEIIYIDNNSKDKTFSIINNRIKNLKDIRLFKTNKGLGMGPGIARNLGVSKSHSNHILFVDVDDYLKTNHIKKLIRYIKENNYNFIYLKKKLISIQKSKIKLSPYIKYDKNNLNKFFTISNNMQAISIIFKKKFLMDHKIKFKKGIFEDIFYLFKCHFFNSSKIGYFSHDVYIKIDNQHSITNTSKTINHIKFKFNAWKSIEFFLKKNLTKDVFNELKSDIQYRWRGEFFNEYQQIMKSRFNKNKKVLYINYIKRLYKKFINKKFAIITFKDKQTKEKLFNV